MFVELQREKDEQTFRFVFSKEENGVSSCKASDKDKRRRVKLNTRSSTESFSSFSQNHRPRHRTDSLDLYVKNSEQDTLIGKSNDLWCSCSYRTNRWYEDARHRTYAFDGRVSTVVPLLFDRIAVTTTGFSRSISVLPRRERVRCVSEYS